MLLREHAPWRCGRVLVEDAARAILHALNREGLRQLAHHAERGIRVGQVDQPHLATAEGERQPIALDLIERCESEAVRDLEHRVEAEIVERPHRRYVER